MRGSTKAHEDAIEVAGLGTFALKPEGEPIGYTDPLTGARRRVTHATYGRGFRLTEEMKMDDQWEVMEKMPADLAMSARDHRETLAWALLNDAFAGATFTGLDGLSLVNAAHVNLDGTTVSNAVTPAVALSVTGLEAAETIFNTMTSQEGRFISLKGRWLVVPPALSHQAKRLLQSEFDPESGDNAINTVKTTETGYAPFMVQYLTNPNNWFVVADKRQHSLMWWNRMDVTFDRGADFASKDSLFDGRYRASNVHRDWRGVVGSAP